MQQATTVRSFSLTELLGSVRRCLEHSWGYGESRKVSLRLSYSFGRQRFNKVEKQLEEHNRL